MTERRIGHLIEIYFMLIVVFVSLRKASTVATGPLSGNVTSGISNDFHCTADNNWRGNGLTLQDCKAAIERLYTIEVRHYGGQDLEFLSPRATQRLPNPMRTPRGYIFGECFGSPYIGGTLG